MHPKKKTEWPRGLLLAIGPCWKQWRHFEGQDMNAPRLTRLIVRGETVLYSVANLSFDSSYRVAPTFTAITSADWYEKLTEHLGPDKKVCC